MVTCQTLAVAVAAVVAVAVVVAAVVVAVLLDERRLRFVTFDAEQKERIPQFSTCGDDFSMSLVHYRPIL